VTAAHLGAKPGHTDTFRVVMEYGPPNQLPADVDGGAVMDGYVSLSWLSRLVDDPDLPGAPAAESPGPGHGGAERAASPGVDRPPGAGDRADAEAVAAVNAALDRLLAR
jgi:hypothetical protein